MGNFNRDRGNRGGGRFFGRDGFGRKDFDRGGDRGGRGDREMFKTTCSNCGKECEVPFRPTNSKPVYCNDCFPKFGGRGGDRPRFDGRRPQSSVPDQYKGQFENLNIKLDKILRLLQPKMEVSESDKKPKDKMVIVDAQKEVKKEGKTVEITEPSGVLEIPKVKKSSKKASSKAK